MEPNPEYSNRDQLLAERIIYEDREAFEEVFSKYYQGIYILAFRYLKDDALAQDAVQEVFCKLWVKRSSINIQYPLKAYLFAIAKNHILNVLRNNATAQQKIIEYVRNQTTTTSLEDSIKFAETSETIHQLIESLPKKRRVIVKLKLYKGLDNAQIAARLNLSVHTVKFQYYLGIKLLKDHLQIAGTLVSSIISFFGTL